MKQGRYKHMIYSEKLISLELSAVMENSELLNYNVVVCKFNDEPKTYSFNNANALRDFIRSKIVEVS